MGYLHQLWILDMDFAFACCYNLHATWRVVLPGLSCLIHLFLGVCHNYASKTIAYLFRYASLRVRLLVDPHMPKDGSSSPNLVMDNPLSQNPGKPKHIFSPPIPALYM